MRKLTAQLYSYNISAIESASELSINDIDLTSMLTHALGYVDYTDPSIVEELINHANDNDENEQEDGIEVQVIFEDCNIEALKDGLKELEIDYEKISEDKFVKMINYALGFIDYDKLDYSVF